MDVSVNKAEEKLLRLSADPETRREYELRAKKLSDERSRLEDAKEEGFEEGFRKEFRKELKKELKKEFLWGSRLVFWKWLKNC